MKKNLRATKLSLSRETVRRLSTYQLRQAVGVDGTTSQGPTLCTLLCNPTDTCPPTENQCDTFEITCEPC